jgi:hypothetical protein
MLGTASLRFGPAVDVLAEEAFFSRELMDGSDAARFPYDHRVRRNKIDEAEIDLAKPLRRARHRGGDEVEFAVLEHRDALGARYRNGLDRHAKALGHRMHHVEVVADHRGVAGLLEAEWRRSVADADDELAARLDVVEPVGRGRLHQRQAGQDGRYGEPLHTFPPPIRSKACHGGRSATRIAEPSESAKTSGFAGLTSH